MNSTAKLTDQLRFMRNAAPQAYEDFVAAFVKYTAEMKENLVNADESLQQAQGRAQICNKLLQIFEEVRTAR